MGIKSLGCKFAARTMKQNLPAESNVLAESDGVWVLLSCAASPVFSTAEVLLL